MEHIKDVDVINKSFDVKVSSNLVPRVLSLASRKNPVAAGHVAPRIWEPKIREGRRVNSCRYDKSYSAKAREEIAASFIIG